jgi:trehalose 6-phosphate phosphatase
MTGTQQAIQCMPLEEASLYWRERVHSAPALALFLDFDGSISPIVAKPELAAIDSQTKHLIERLKELGGIQIAIVSGRQLMDVRQRTGVDGIIYAGNHGLEIETDTVCFREPRAESLRLEVRRLVLRLEQLLSDATGVEIEEKGVGVAVHYRQVHESLHDWVRRSVQETICHSRVFTCIPGKMVIDVRPAVEWNKGHAVRWLLERYSSAAALPIYIGDDNTDEDAFDALHGDALTVRVGWHPETRARFWVPDVCAVRRLLSAIYELRSHEKRPMGLAGKPETTAGVHGLS